MKLVMDSLEEDLTCSVCYALFTDPRVLPCSHTFCKSCLESVLQVSVNFSIWRPLRLPLKCPNCRSVVELPTNGLDALPVNVCLRAIVEKYQRESRPRSPSCPEHPGQPLNVYCVQDRKLICGFCLTIGQHQGHKIDDLQTAYVKERTDQPTFIQSLRGERWEEMNRLAEQLQMEKTRSEALVQKDREVALVFFQGLELTLAQKKEQFMQALERANVLLNQAYEPLMEQLKGLQEEHSQLQILISSMEEDQESPLEYLEKVHQLRERINTLNCTPMPTVPSLQMSPRAERFIEKHWTDVTLRDLRDGPLPEISWHSESCSTSRAQVSDQTRCWRICVCLCVIMLLLLFCLNRGTHWLSALRQAGENALSGLSQPLRDLGALFCCVMQNTGSKLQAFISTVGEHTHQQLLRFLKELHWC